MVGVRVHERGTEMRTSPSLTARLAIHAALLLLLSCVATHASSSSDIQSHRGAAQAGDSANFFCTLQNERVKMDLEDYDLPVRRVDATRRKRITFVRNSFFSLKFAHILFACWHSVAVFLCRHLSLRLENRIRPLTWSV